MTEKRIAVITGTNGFLGLSVAERLMDETPKDVDLTIVVTSRTFRGVTEAVKSLQAYAWKTHKERPGLIEFDYLLFDQCSMVSVLGAAYEMKKRYKHIDCIIFNACFSQMKGISYWQALKDFCKGPIVAFTTGTFKLQGRSRKTADGLGAAFEANVLAPWFLVQEILPLLTGGSKLIWVSSCISLPEFYDPKDLSILESDNSYEASKYELELLHQATYKKLYSDFGIESWLLQPGVFKSTTFVPTLNIFMYVGMMVMFYICRWCGSPYHCIDPKIAANAPVYLALKADPKNDSMGIKYGSSTTRGGREVLLRTEFNPLQADVDLVYEHVEQLVQEWKLKLKDQVVERVNY